MKRIFPTLLFITPLATHAMNAMEENNQLYEVKLGDTLALIAAKNSQNIFNLNESSYLNEILKLNRFIKDPNIISAHSTLILPKVKPVFHQVSQGDTFYNIAKKYKKSALRTRDFYQTLLSHNKHISNPNLIHIGDKIIIGHKFDNTEMENKFAFYRIKKGDYITKVIQKFYGLKNPQHYIDLMQKLNPQIADLNQVQINQIIRLPARKNAKLAFQKSMPLQRRAPIASPKRELASIKRIYQYEPSSELRAEIAALSSAEAKNYIKLFESIATYENKKQLITNLQDIKTIANTFGHGHLEDTFFQLTTSLIRNKNESFYQADLKNFFTIWKDERKKVNRSR